MKKNPKHEPKSAPKMSLSSVLGVGKVEPVPAANLADVFAHGSGKSASGAKSVSGGKSA